MSVVTHTANAEKHPGRVLAMTPRHSSVEVQADKERKREMKEQKENKTKHAVKNIASLENKMADEDISEELNRVTKRAKVKTGQRRHGGRSNAEGTVAKPAQMQHALQPKWKMNHADDKFEKIDLPTSDSEQPRKRQKGVDERPRIAIERARLEGREVPARHNDDKGKAPKRTGVSAPAQKTRTVPSGPLHDWQSSALAPWKLGSMTSVPHFATTGLQAETADVPSRQNVGRRNAEVTGVLVQETGFASDDSEGAEETAALSSPIKGAGTQLTSAGLVKLDEDSDLEATPFARPIYSKGRKIHFRDESNYDVDDMSQPVRLKRVTNDVHDIVKVEDHASNLEDADNDSEDYEESVKSSNNGHTVTIGRRPNSKKANLPAGANDGDRFTRVLIPTLHQYVGSLREPWAVKDEKLVHVLQLIWKAIYPQIPYIIKHHDHVFNIVHGFGTSALAVLDLLYGRSHCTTEAECQRLAEHWKENMRFVYEHADRSPKQWTGLFHSEIISRLLGSHLSNIRGAISDVPNLMDKNVPPIERALTFWTTGIMFLQNGESKMLKNTNPASGKLTTATAFGEDKYAKMTKSYSKFALDLPPKKMAKVIECAIWYMKAGTRHAPIEIDDDEEDDMHAKLADAGSDSE
ncbi:uncharacterized protein LAESUDRAFT_713558 [Laetiporus sulphureus 93-53]|uniref:Uncharacterized protein n=1 Tax=Laetiporus sulphureus 93-53 TaxID=1314785 RepID=A0A165ENU2_9APHY|nr:uncharacterized protein LAESUDRAFT_713558 [Laetiporus sulphureus 93-53]KZT07451.1 hypothetical protein LAESUDRAFT_713558 [Laetiporus sulphureus 93-53]